MNNNYAIYENGFRVKILENSTDADAIMYAEKYSTQNPNNWISVVRLTSPRVEIFNQCLNFMEV